VARRRALLVAIIAAVIGLWALAYSGAIGNWTMVWCLLAVVVVLPWVPYLIDYQRGEAAPAFGMPERRSTPAPAPVSAIRLPAPVERSASSSETAVTSLGSES
jgi:hypothetical protein